MKWCTERLLIAIEVPVKSKQVWMEGKGHVAILDSETKGSRQLCSALDQEW